MTSPRPHPEDIQDVALDGQTLTIEQVVAVARHRARVTVSERARAGVDRARTMVEVLLERGAKVYGLTTGFGKLRDVPIAKKDLARLQLNLIRSHACGVGAPLDEEVVRAALVLRANTLCRGNSGIRFEVIEAIARLLNDGIYPYVPAQGSVGSSGDLAPLSHLSLVLVGDPQGRVLPRSRRSGPAPLRRARADEFVPVGQLPWRELTLTGEEPGFRPVTLQAKEGLALNNGTQVMTALACLVIHDAGRGLEWAELATAMSLEAQRGVRMAFQPELHRARDLPGQADTAGRILARVEGSEVLDLLLNTASLRRVREHLHEVLEHLERPPEADRAEGGGAEPVHDLAGRARPHVQAVLEALDPLVPGRDARQEPAPALLEQRGRPPRAQIEAFQRLLAPLRREVTDLLGVLDGRDGHAAVPFARDAAVRALLALAHAVPAAPPVQDDYSFRCSPQVLGCAHRALDHARGVVGVEINAATDNPLLFPPEPPVELDRAGYARWLADPARAETLVDRVLGGGNFHGEPVGKVMDYLAIAMAEVGSIAERRIAHLVDESVSNGLPPFLMESSGLNSGFMIPQYTAAALVSENKVLVHPASADSIPTCAGSEDHNSMGTIAARQAAEVLDNVLHVVAIEVLTAMQALSFRRPLRPGRGVAAALALLEEQGFRPYSDDQVLHPDILRVRELLRRPPGAQPPA